MSHFEDELSDFSSDEPDTPFSIGSSNDEFVLTPVRRKTGEISHSIGAQGLLKCLEDQGSPVLIQVLETLTNGSVSVVTLRPVKVVQAVLPLVIDRNDADTPRIAILLCQLLKALAFCDTHKDILVKSDCIQLIIGYLNSNDKDMRKQDVMFSCVDLLLVLAYNAESRRLLGSTIETVLGAMKIFYCSHDFQLVACKLLQTLSFEEANKSLIIANDGIRAVLDVMSNFLESNAMLMHGCGMLYFMIFEIEALVEQNETYDILLQIFLVLPGVISSQASASETKTQALALLAAMITAYEPDPENSKDLREIAAESGIIESSLMVMMIMSADTEVLTDGSNILHTLVMHGPSRIAFINKAGTEGIKNVINAAVVAMGEHIKSSGGTDSIQLCGQEIITVLSEELQIRMRSPEPESPNDEVFEVKSDTMVKKESIELQVQTKFSEPDITPEVRIRSLEPESPNDEVFEMSDTMVKKESIELQNISEPDIKSQVRMRSPEPELPNDEILEIKSDTMVKKEPIELQNISEPDITPELE